MAEQQQQQEMHKFLEKLAGNSDEGLPVPQTPPSYITVEGKIFKLDPQTSRDSSSQVHTQPSIEQLSRLIEEGLPK